MAGMSQSKDAQEPSMEEILSSIRRIIADEEKDRPAAQAAEPSRSMAAGDEDDVLELTDVAEDEAPPPAPEPVTPALTPPVATRTEPIKETAAVAASKDDSLVSAGAANASTNAFSKLTRAMTDDKPAAPTIGRSVDDLLTELLRPMLKDWLDQNLAGIVERVVEQEVKKLARRAELM
jgi:cell pole-organizing protein PopZ